MGILKNVEDDNDRQWYEFSAHGLYSKHLIARKKSTVRIAYDVAKQKAEAAKEHAEVKSYKELGETTFDYYLKLEEIVNEECDGTEL